MPDLMPKYVLGTVLPRGDLSSYQPYQFYRLVPNDVLIMSVPLGVQAFTREAVGDAFSRYWECADRLVEKGAERVVQMGVPVASLMGREYILNLIEETGRRYGVPGGADVEMLVEGLEHLGVKALALGTFFSAPVNQIVADHFKAAEIRVVGQTSWEHVLTERKDIGLKEGMELIVELGRATLRAAPAAEALIMPGGTWPTIHAAEVLEREFGKPVIANYTALVWSALRAPGIVPPITGWGRLLARD